MNEGLLDRRWAHESNRQWASNKSDLGLSAAGIVAYRYHDVFQPQGYPFWQGTHLDTKHLKQCKTERLDSLK